MAVAKLDKRHVARALFQRNPDGSARQALIFDTELKGFGLCVGREAKTFFVQREINGRSVRMVIGRYGVFTVQQARQKARKLIGQMADGINPVAEKRKARARGITLAQALALTETSLLARGRVAKTVDGLKYAINTYLKDWLDRPLTDITRADVRARHQQLAEDVAKGKFADGRERNKGHGKYTANRAMIAFRAVYNRALCEHPELPSNPIVNVDWFKTERPTALPLTELHTWHAKVATLTNPIRRDYLRFTLHTGLRRKNASEAQWAHVDLERRVLHVPYPKTGRPFDLPLTGYLLEMLQARRKENAEAYEASPWIFPASSKTGHIAEPREDFDGIKWKVHDLRRWFITCAESLDISPYSIKLLVNHALPSSDVTAGYLQMEVERLRPAMEAIGEKLRTLCLPPASKVVQLPRVGVKSERKSA